MTVRPRFRHTRKALLTLAAAATLALGGLIAAGGASSARAATQEPCDIYAAGGTPCVAAHSTTRALYAAYSGNLYQVRRSSDNTTLNIGPVSREVVLAAEAVVVDPGRVRLGGIDLRDRPVGRRKDLHARVLSLPRRPRTRARS